MKIIENMSISKSAINLNVTSHKQKTRVIEKFLQCYELMYLLHDYFTRLKNFSLKFLAQWKREGKEHKNTRNRAIIHILLLTLSNANEQIFILRVENLILAHLRYATHFSLCTYTHTTCLFSPPTYLCEFYFSIPPAVWFSPETREQEQSHSSPNYLLYQRNHFLTRGKKESKRMTERGQIDERRQLQNLIKPSYA